MEGQEYHFTRIRDLIVDESAEDRLKHLQTEAQILAELCNINAFRATETDYRNWATKARDDSLKVAEAAQAANVNAAKDLVRAIQSSCRSCHDKYQD